MTGSGSVRSSLSRAALPARSRRPDPGETRLSVHRHFRSGIRARLRGKHRVHDVGEEALDRQYRRQPDRRRIGKQDLDWPERPLVVAVGPLPPAAVTVADLLPCPAPRNQGATRPAPTRAALSAHGRPAAPATGEHASRARTRPASRTISTVFASRNWYPRRAVSTELAVACFDAQVLISASRRCAGPRLRRALGQRRRDRRRRRGRNVVVLPLPGAPVRIVSDCGPVAARAAARCSALRPRPRTAPSLRLGRASCRRQPQARGRWQRRRAASRAYPAPRSSSTGSALATTGRPTPTIGSTGSTRRSITIRRLIPGLRSEC